MAIFDAYKKDTVRMTLYKGIPNLEGRLVDIRYTPDLIEITDSIDPKRIQGFSFPIQTLRVFVVDPTGKDDTLVLGYSVPDGVWLISFESVPATTGLLKFRDAILTAAGPVAQINVDIPSDIMPRNKNKKKELIRQETRLIKYNDLLEERNFQITKDVQIGDSHLLADDTNKEIAICWMSRVGINGKERNVKFIAYTDILEFELNEDGSSVAKGKGLATAVGGIAFGPVGALIGASTKKKTQNMCSYMAIRILINDLQNPTFELKLIDIATDKNNIIYKTLHDQALQAIGVLTYIENINKYSTESLVGIQPTSMADELREIKALLDEGILTQDEFDLKKRQILGV